MIFISHRGNINEKNPELENRPDYILKALENGYECECDVWKKDENWFLGHDEPQYEVSSDFLNHKGLWIHAKNYEALAELIENFHHVNFFSHDKDPYTITSKGYIWAYPGQNLHLGKTICVMPELAKYTKEEKKQAFGICSDFIENERNCL